MKDLGFINIEIKDLSLDVIKQIEDAFGQELSMAPNIMKLKTYITSKE